MRRTNIAPVVLVCLALWSANSWGRSLEIDANQAAVIKPSVESSEVRLLVQFALPNVLSGHSIDFACMSFGADCAGDKGAISFQAFALTSGWDAKSVSWTGPWENAGGDWNRSLSTYGISEAGSGKTAELDVTEFANRWLKEPSKNFGIVIKVSGPFSGTFTTDRSKGLPKLRVLY